MRPIAKPSGFLFGGEAPWCYSTMTRRFRKGQKLLQISGYGNHDFRTTYGTQLKESGMTSAQVADLMGTPTPAWWRQSTPAPGRRASRNAGQI